MRQKSVYRPRSGQVSPEESGVVIHLLRRRAWSRRALAKVDGAAESAGTSAAADLRRSGDTGALLRDKPDR